MYLLYQRKSQKTKKMPDQEISILIKAVDEATATLKNIEKQMVSSGKNMQETSKNTANAFTKTQGALLQLGQVAQGVHNIFETYERVNLRLENAQDRVENATIRLKNAQDSLRQATQKLIDIEEKHQRDSITLERAKLNLERATKAYNHILIESGKESISTREAYLDLQDAQLDLADAQKLGTKKSQELKEAENDLKRKTEELKISENNLDIAQRKLTKTTNDAKWAYVDMGVQMISLSAQIPTMLKSLGDLGFGFNNLGGSVGGLSKNLVGVTTTFGGWTTAGVVGLAALGIAGIGFAVEDLNKKLKDLEEQDKKMQMETIVFAGGPAEEMMMRWSSMPKSVADANNATIPKFKEISDAWALYGANPITGKINEVDTGILGMALSFDTMKNESVPKINEVTDALNDIPTEIYTTHYIETVYV